MGYDPAGLNTHNNTQTDTHSDTHTDTHTDNHSPPNLQRIDNTRVTHTDPVSPTSQQTDSSSDQQTHTSTDQQTQSITDQQTHSSTDQQTKSITDQQTHSSTDQTTHSSTDQQTHTSTDQQTHSSTDQQTHSSTDQQTHSSTDQQTHSSTEPQTHSSTEPQTNSSLPRTLLLPPFEPTHLTSSPPKGPGEPGRTHIPHRDPLVGLTEQDGSFAWRTIRSITVQQELTFTSEVTLNLNSRTLASIPVSRETEGEGLHLSGETEGEGLPVSGVTEGEELPVSGVTGWEGLLGPSQFSTDLDRNNQTVASSSEADITGQTDSLSSLETELTNGSNTLSHTLHTSHTPHNTHTNLNSTPSRVLHTLTPGTLTELNGMSHTTLPSHSQTHPTHTHLHTNTPSSSANLSPTLPPGLPDSPVFPFSLSASPSLSPDNLYKWTTNPYIAPPSTTTSLLLGDVVQTHISSLTSDDPLLVTTTTDTMRDTHTPLLKHTQSAHTLLTDTALLDISPGHTPVPLTSVSPAHTLVPEHSATHTPLPEHSAAHTPLPGHTVTKTPLPGHAVTNTPLPGYTVTHTSFPGHIDTTGSVVTTTTSLIPSITTGSVVTTTTSLIPSITTGSVVTTTTSLIPSVTTGSVVTTTTTVLPLLTKKPPSQTTKLPSPTVKPIPLTTQTSPWSRNSRHPAWTEPYPSEGSRLAGTSSGLSQSTQISKRRARIYIVPDLPATIKEVSIELLLQVILEDTGFDLTSDLTSGSDLTSNLTSGSDLTSDLTSSLEDDTTAWVAPYLQRAPGFQDIQAVWSSGRVVQSLVMFRTSEALAWLGVSGAESLLERTGLAQAVGEGRSFRGSKVTNITVGGVQSDVCVWLFQCPAGYECVWQPGDLAVCSSLCHSEFCHNQGICTHQPEQLPLCQCPVGDHFWFMGSRCDVKMTRQRLVGACLGVLVAMVVVISLLACLAVRRYRAMLIHAKVDQTRSSYRRFNHFDELSGRFWGRSVGGSADSLDNPAFTHSDELLHLRALDRTCCYHDDTLSLASTCPSNGTHLNTVYQHSSQYGWALSEVSLAECVVDSGKASDLSVCSWPIEPIQWTPFPLLQQLASSQRATTVRTPNCPHREPLRYAHPTVLTENHCGTHTQLSSQRATTVRVPRPRSYCEGMELVEMEKSWTA
uniref:EGF-like domain-containing protein n=1 Tax=Esox lucius TaxID=8010 RepID=A0A3P8XWA2_ESOLU